MSDKQNYAIWKPEHDGHAPPYWREGMFEEHRHRDFGISWVSSTPTWAKDYEYRVPAEALNSPNDDAKDVEPQDPRRSVQEALAILRGYSPDELAKHGITLAEPKDWATELWADLVKTHDRNWYLDVQAGDLEDFDRAAIALIRERVVLK